MQYLKEHLREKILEAAEESYYEMGYGMSNLREIAAKCGITVGNLYNYYKNKEALLDAVLKPLIDDIGDIVEELLSTAMLEERKVHQQFHLMVAMRLSELCQNHSKSTRILISGTAGTKYEDYFHKLVHRVAVGMKGVIEREIPLLNINPILYEILAKNHVEGILYIIQNVTDFDEKKEAIQQFLDIHLSYFESIKLESRSVEVSHEKV